MSGESLVPIRRYVDVRQRPTVVRLDALQHGAEWITASFFITRDIRDHLQGLSHVLQQPTGCGIFLIGQYGSGKSHWLAYVTCQLRQGTLVADPPDVVPLSLLNYRAAIPLERIVSEALGISLDQDDRRSGWTEWQARRPRGVLLLLDELSEFLRSKPDHRAFNEDVRFLQYMGEWAQTQRFWVLAAMQEGIEHTGNLEYGLYRKIKDRFPLRFLLSPTHVKDLIHESILVKQAGYREAVDALADEVRQALPGSTIGFEDLRILYPLHPATLELLEEVRDRFSQTRGIVDFTVTQLGGAPSRGIAPFLDRPWGSLLTPDVIIDHFRDLFELQPEFLGLAQQFFPYYRKQLPELFSVPAVRDLAERLLKLLVLTHLSPSREGLTVREAADWLLFRAARIDSRKNLEILERTLRQLAERGRYIVERQGRFYLELRDDGSAALEAFLEREKEQLREQGETVFEQLADELEADDFNPLRLPRDEWQPRQLRWHSHERPYHLFVGNGTPPPCDGVGLCLRLPWGTAGPAPGVYTLRPAPLALTEELIELAALSRARHRPWSRDVKKRLEGRLRERVALLRSQLRTAYRDLELIGPSGEPETPPRFDPASSLRAWLEQYAECAMRRRYPAFERFAPTYGPLPKEAYRSLMRFAAKGELGDYDADEFVKLIREGYLIPMRLLTRQGRSYAVAANLERHELVALIRPLLDIHASPAIIYENAAQSVYGLVPDQVGVMLVLLHIVGELDLLKGRQSYREVYETLPNPLQYDKVARCSALSLEQLRDLEVLCEGLRLRQPKEWTVSAQRQAVHQLKEIVGRQLDPLRALLVKLQGEDQAEELVAALQEVFAWERTLRQGLDDLGDVQQFLFEIGSPRRFLAALSELSGLPERLERLMSERRRFQHLFHHPALATCTEPALAVQIESLCTPPSLAQPELVEQWLSESRKVYEQYKAGYRQRHDAWWQDVARDPLWNWQPPPVAACRHLGLGDALNQVRICRQNAERLRCAGLVNLDFQPLCACAFDGATSPIAEEMLRWKALQESIERAVGTFFQQESVRKRLREWSEQGVESNRRLIDYLQGEAPYPEVANCELLDRYLAGIELVKQADVSPVVDLLCDRTWDRESWLQALQELWDRMGATRLRLRRADAGDVPEIVEWSLQQALRFGVPLPPSLRGRTSADLVESIRPEWVSADALSRLEDLGLGARGVERVIRWLLEGQVALPDATSARRSSLVAAAMHVVQPSRPTTAEELAELAARLYRAHDAMLPIAGAEWLNCLESLARTRLTPPPLLSESLSRLAAAQCLLIDCLGLPLVDAVRQQMGELLPDWQIAELSFARVEDRTTTDSCYRQLIDAGFRHKFEKINCIDTLLHERFLPFEDFVRLALAELAIACRTVRSRLDVHTPLVVFADHGFRLAPDGRSYCHGGDSTLERLVPVFQLQPR